MKALKYVVMAVLLVCAFAMAGCGSDKFVGTWYAYSGSGYEKMTVEKDNNNYLIKRDIVLYSRTCKQLGNRKEDWIYSPYVMQSFNSVGHEKNGSHLYINPLNDFVYVEKDKSLRHGNNFYYKGDEAKKKVLEKVEAYLLKEGDKWKKVAEENSLMNKINNVSVVHELKESQKAK